MKHRLHATALAAAVLCVVLSIASTATASPLSLLGGNCGTQVESQPFIPWLDNASYTPVPGGNFETGLTGWELSGGAGPAAGNETFNVSGAGNTSLSLPAYSAALSPAVCTNLYHPTLRFFVRNTGSSSSHLLVQAIYPTLLGTATSTVATLSGSSSWAPTPILELLLPNVLSTVSLDQTVVAFRFVPADTTGQWAIDDVLIDPFHRM